MPRFFFNVREDGVLRDDTEGVVCADAAQACAGAMDAMCRFAVDTAANRSYWSVQLEVADEVGRVIATYSTPRTPAYSGVRGCRPVDH